MGDWCADHLRDCAGWASEGLSLSTTSNECAKLFDATLRQLVSWINCEQLGGFEKTIGGALAADPKAILPRTFILTLHTLGTGTSVWSDAKYKKDIDEMARDAEIYGNRREQLHAKAGKLYAYGEMRKATVVWEDIIREFPNDVMALKFAHDAYFFMGDCRGKRDSAGRVLERIRPDMPLYSYVHGMYAFGLEECQEYKKAEDHAILALSLQKQDCWATHARAHCMEMNGRTKEGILFMEETVEDWEPCFMLATHNFWHNALFYIEDGEYDVPMQLFDKQLNVRTTKSGAMLDYVDAASLLWRLELEGVNVGDRWKNLIPIHDHFDDHVIVFNEVHFGPSLERSGDDEGVEQLRNSMDNFIHTASGDNRRITEHVGMALYDGMVAYSRGKYTDAAKYMLPIRDQIVNIGGSNAQRDIFTQTLIHACLNSDDKEVFDMGLVTLAERDNLKKNSGISARLAERFKQKLRC